MSVTITIGKTGEPITNSCYLNLKEAQRELNSAKLGYLDSRKIYSCKVSFWLTQAYKGHKGLQGDNFILATMGGFVDEFNFAMKLLGSGKPTSNPPKNWETFFFEESFNPLVASVNKLITLYEVYISGIESAMILALTGKKV